MLKMSARDCRILRLFYVSYYLETVLLHLHTQQMQLENMSRSCHPLFFMEGINYDFILRSWAGGKNLAPLNVTLLIS